jgi:hypothetical protein
VNIIRDYFTFKARINEFLRLSPLSPVVIRLIDTDDTLQRLEIILETVKDNLGNKMGRQQKVPAESSNKRKHDNDDVFDVSQSNTSTPETAHPAKRLRKSLTTPFLTLSANKQNKTKSTADKSMVVERSELDCQNSSSSSDTPDKEEEEEDVGVSRKTCSSPHVLKTNSEVNIIIT